MVFNRVGYPIVKLGKGLVVVGEGNYDKKPALILSLNGSGVVGEPITTPGVVPNEVVLSVITFDNLECVDVLIEVATRLRDRMASKQQHLTQTET